MSNLALPRAAVQEDADKVMIRWGDQLDERLWFRREDSVDYWEGVD